jgi:ferredoxin
MKLYYFTGTGNSLAVARRLAADIPNTTLLPILGANLGEHPTGALGLVFPVHMVGVPIPVRTYLETADLRGLDYFFAVATHGGIPGKVGALVNHLVGSRGRRHLDDFFPLHMILNTPKGVAPRPLMTMNWADKIKKGDVDAMVERTALEIAAIARFIIAHRSSAGGAEESRMPKRMTRPGALTRLLWKAADGSTPSLSFLLDAESCSRCGTCGAVCPTGRVVLNGDIPRWDGSRPCYFCYACFNFCPEQAIGVKHYTFKTGRYHHPEVSALDVAAQKCFHGTAAP